MVDSAEIEVRNEWNHSSDGFMLHFPSNYYQKYYQSLKYLFDTLENLQNDSIIPNRVVYIILDHINNTRSASHSSASLFVLASVAI